MDAYRVPIVLVIAVALDAVERFGRRVAKSFDANVVNVILDLDWRCADFGFDAS